MRRNGAPYIILGIVLALVLPPLFGYIYLKYIMGLHTFNINIVGFEMVGVYPDALKLGLLANLLPFWLSIYVIKSDSMLRSIVGTTIFWGFLLMISYFL
jgi:hypothetical protein